jgi:L,D-transpeptidase catalytic domain
VEHRRGTGRRRRGGHRAKPRYGRIAVLVGSFVLTLGVAGAAAGFVPYSDGEDAPTAAAAEDPAGADSAVDDAATEDPAGGADASESDTGPTSVSGAGPEAGHEPTPSGPLHGDPRHAPDDSGQGRRVVYDMSDQRVWLVGEDESVRRSYLVSGSVLDNLRAGSYEVYSRSRHAVSFDQESTMDYMVRFTEGDNAAIGFHDIPEDLAGRPLQELEQLGTPQSHGCIRQRTSDAQAMWRFADLDTPVEVLA